MSDLKQGEAEVMAGELCMFCKNKSLTLSEVTVEVPYFGMTHVFSMDCSSCGYHKADIEPEEKKEPARYSLDISSEEDLKIRVVKSSEASVKIPYVGDTEPGEASNGYITNVEGIINRFKHRIETMRDEAEDPAEKKKAKNLLKKINKALWGQEKLKLIIEDPSGNSAIISDKAEKKKL